MDKLPGDILDKAIAETGRLLAKGAYAEARRAIRRFMRLRIARRVEAQLQLMLCDSYLTEGQWEKGLRILDSLKTKVSRDKDPKTAASILNRIAFSLVFKGDITGAARYYRRSLRIYEQKGISSSTAADNVSDLAYIDRLRGSYRKALSGYEQAVEMYDSLTEKAGRARALHSIARLKSLLVETDAAITGANEALSLATETGQRPLMADCLWLLGLLLFEKGDLPEGLQHIERAVQESSSTGGAAFVRACVAFVRVLTWIGAFDEAKLWGEDALATARRLKQVLGVAHCHLLLARIRLLEDDYVGTLHYAREAGALFHSSADNVSRARALLCEAEALVHTQQFKQAKQTLEAAVLISGKTDDIVLKSDCGITKASLLLAQEEFKQSTASALGGLYKRLRHRHVHKCLEVGYHLAAMLMFGGKVEEVLSITQELFESSQSIIVSLPEEYRDSYQSHPITRAIIELSLKAHLKRALQYNSVEKMIDAVDEFRKLTIRTRRPSVRAETELVYKSDSMRELVRAAEGIAPMDAPVLITGETGVGKDVLARFIHRLSIREGSFVPLNCAAVPSSLIESELFGYAKGAFTGANADKKGLFLSADNGTLFLDEIGNMPLDMQAKLLRVLEEGRIRPVGSTEHIDVNVRILSATNRDLKYEVEQGRFREDLFYRINAITIKIPTLRDRREDIPALIEHFIKESGKEFEIEEDALHALIQYDWPGNVRELESEITHLVFVSEGRIEKGMLKKEIREPQGPSPASGTLQDMERNLIKEVLEKTGYNKQKTARLLGIAKSTLYEKMRRYKIDSTELKPRSKTGR